MMNGNQLYELARIREREYMSEAGLLPSGRRNRLQTAGVIAGVTRRLRRRHAPQD